MRKFITIIIIILAVLTIAGLVFDWGRKGVVAPISNQSSTTTEESSMQISYPKENQEVTSPIKISGKAQGNWFFEAIFPIKLVDSGGNIISTGQAQAIGDWATSSFVDFSSEITYDNATSTGRAVLIFKNDNPSGDPARDKYFYLPVILK